jgi:predicted ATPase/class 3 adenylate cyclase
MSATRSLPTGTITFLRTDIEGSMRLMRDLGADWDSVNASHMGILRQAIDRHGGVCVRTEGDAVFAVFPEARAAVASAVEAQQALHAHEWPDGIDFNVRMGLHSGEAYLAGDDYGGFEVNRAARIASAAHGGQIVLSDATRALVVDALPDGVGIRDLGRHALRDLPVPERIHQLDVPGLRSEFPTLRTTAATSGNLPDRLTSFVGREHDIEAIRALLATNRLVTLTGPGGIGKSSLAVEMARTVAERFRDGVWFVGLADVEDPSTVRPVIARTIGLHDGAGRSAAEALGPYLKERAVLLVMDNFEHLLEAASEVSAILEASAGSRVLATSRAPLRLLGEQEYPVDPLGDACARLFVERARAVRPGWEPGPDSATVDEVCTLVDGLPLGVELVAVRVAHLPITALRDRLAAHLPLPGSGPRNVPDRQRTLEEAIGWSHDLLPEATRVVLHDLAVFDGGFDLDQAQEVVEPPADGADVLEHLVALVDHSLLQRDTPVAGGPGIRFRLLETIRRFAFGRLNAEGRETAARRRQALAYLTLAELAAPNLPGADQPRWLDRLAIDYPNLRAAIRWAIDVGEVELAQRFVAALWRFWQQDGRLVDATEFAEEVLTMAGSNVPTPARLAATAAAGNVAYWHGRPSDAIRHYQEELALARQLGDVVAEADAWWNLSFEKYIAGDAAGALDVAERAQRLYEQAGDERGAARLEWSRLAALSGEQPAPDTKAALLALLDRFERLGDVWFAGQTMMSIAWVTFETGDVPGASRWFIRAFSMAHAYRDVTSTTIAIPLGALIAVMAGRGEDAARLLGASAHLTELYGVKAPVGLGQLIDAADPSRSAEEMIGPERYAEAFASGARMSLDEAVALVVRVQDETWGPG